MLVTYITHASLNSQKKTIGVLVSNEQESHLRYLRNVSIKAKVL